MATERVKPGTPGRRAVVQELDQLVHALTVVVLNARGYAVGDFDSVDESVDKLVEFLEIFERARKRGG